ncbi:zinc finger FYVE domain-containing protein 21-like isoform X2 [Ischnura elegans]|uniref:zinc finger FYVE domain-containing protein 21-like isoform X2 n=1 Tax=Ischnura elegans TaxID=197161 RepID=UPI001ED88CDC|nr:zinc finger FYVE domain-containing protein 21-like isoform X2 [Ischnura elegans]
MYSVRYQQVEMESSAKKLLRSKSGLRIVVVNDRFRSPFVLSEPQWSPDGENDTCFSCKARFDFLTRKHHCRRCGQVYCKACCNLKEALPRMCFVDPVRLCISCESIARKEKSFFDVHLKTLLSGARFKLSSSGSPQVDEDLFTCRLSNDHRHIIFDGSASYRPEPLPFVEIKSVSIVRNSDEGIQNGLRMQLMETPLMPIWRFSHV